MIVTFTANPSIDRTMRLDGRLRRGQFQRAAEVTDQASGKGMNVATVLRDAGEPVTAVVAFADQSYLGLGRASGGVEPLVALVRPGLRVRTNITITEPDGTTTKVDELGPRLDDGDAELITEAVVYIARQYQADWVMLSGSLPVNAPDDWYVQIAGALRPLGCRISVDTSGQAMTAVLAGLAKAPIDLLTPNVEELAHALGADAPGLQLAAGRGELDVIVTGAREVQARGVAELLVTLGGAGAVLVSGEGAWYGEALPVKVASTVGAGDAALAGYVLASQRGLDAAGRLAYAIAHGSVTAASPGTTLGQPSTEELAAVRVTRIG